MNLKKLRALLALVLCATVFIPMGILWIPAAGETSPPEPPSATESQEQSSKEETSWETDDVSSSTSSLPAASAEEDASASSALSQPEPSSSVSSAPAASVSSQPASSPASSSQRNSGTSFTSPSSAAASPSDTVSSEEDSVGQTQSASPYWDEMLQSLLNQACSYLSKTDTRQSELYFLVMYSAGKTVSVAQVTDFTHRLTNDGFQQQTKLQQAYNLLNLTFCGYHPGSFQGEDLLSVFCDVEDVTSLSLEELCYLLLALDSNQYTLPAETAFTRSDICSAILQHRQPDGSFLSEEEGDLSGSYLTALALTALAPYRSREDQVDLYLHQGIDFLSNQQGDDGSILENGVPSCRATAQTIIALCSLQVDLRNFEFIQNQNTLFHGLRQFLCSDGGFSEQSAGAASQLSSTQTAILALTAIKDNDSPYVLSVLLGVEEASLGAQEEQPAAEGFLWIWLSIGFAVALLAAGVIWFSIRRRSRLTLHPSQDSVPEERTDKKE